MYGLLILSNSQTQPYNIILWSVFKGSSKNLKEKVRKLLS